MEENEIMTARETDRLLGLPRGRTAKLARDGHIPCVTIPAVGKGKSEIRFLRSAVESWLHEQSEKVAR